MGPSENLKPIYRPRLDQSFSLVRSNPSVGLEGRWLLDALEPLAKDAEDECERLRAALEEIRDFDVCDSNDLIQLQRIAKEALDVSAGVKLV